MWYLPFLLACAEAERAVEVTEAVDFGQVPEGEVVTRAVSVRNLGDWNIDVSSPNFGRESYTFDLLTEMDGFAVVGFEPTVVAPGETLDIEVVHEGTGSDEAAELTLYVQYVGAFAVALSASAAPALTTDPDPVEFGYVAAGATETQTLRLSNPDDAPLTITGLTLDDPAYRVAADLPIELAGRGEGEADAVEIEVTFAPTDEARHVGRLDIETDWGDERVTLDGSSSLQAPTARCSADPRVGVVGERMVWSGETSRDPTGLALTYAWSLVAPEGSAASFGGAGERVSYTPDVAGAYAATLVVTNEAGVASEPCVARLDALPAPEVVDLSVTLTWAQANDDMDLHLVRDDGELGGDADCHYANCPYGELDWGVVDYERDDPWMEPDDTWGIGPERVGIEAPANGTYTVWVHDHPGYVSEDPNEVTIEVYMRGELAWTTTLAIAGEDEAVPIVDLVFPGGTVVPR